MERRLWSSHSSVTAVGRVALRREWHLVDTATLFGSSSHRLIPPFKSAPGFGDWPGLVHNFASSGPLSPGFCAMIRQPVAQNLKYCPCIQRHTLHECTPDRISAPRRQRPSPPRTCHTRRPACAGDAALPHLHSRLHASCCPHARPGPAGTALCAPSRPRVLVAGALALFTGCHLFFSPDNRK